LGFARCRPGRGLPARRRTGVPARAVANQAARVQRLHRADRPAESPARLQGVPRRGPDRRERDHREMDHREVDPLGAARSHRELDRRGADRSRRVADRLAPDHRLGEGHREMHHLGEDRNHRAAGRLGDRRSRRVRRAWAERRLAAVDHPVEDRTREVADQSRAAQRPEREADSRPSPQDPRPWCRQGDSHPSAQEPVAHRETRVREVEALERLQALAAHRAASKRLPKAARRRASFLSAAA
jgi:hypothetical protein